MNHLTVKVLKTLLAAALFLLLTGTAFPETITPDEEGFVHNPPSSSAESGNRGTYDAYVKIYIVEKVSPRWVYFDGTSIPMAFLDFAYNEHVSLRQGVPLNETILWNPADLAFAAPDPPSVDKNNILAIAVVFTDNPQPGYCAHPDAPSSFVSNHVEACAAADWHISWPHPPAPPNPHGF